MVDPFSGSAVISEAVVGVSEVELAVGIAGRFGPVGAKGRCLRVPGHRQIY